MADINQSVLRFFFRGKVENKRKLGSGVGVHVHWVRVRVRAFD